MAAIRNLITFNDVLYAVRADQLIRVDAMGVETAVATIGSAGGPLDMAQNLTQLVMGDGAQLYVWDGSNLTTVSSLAVGNSLTFLDQRIVFPLLNSQQFTWSALGDATSYDPLDFASAEGSPDTLVAIIATLGQLLLLGENTGEVWRSVGGTTVFERSTSEYLQIGCAAPRSVVLVGDDPIWMARDDAGQVNVVRQRGIRISTRAIEERFEGLDVSGASAYTITDGPFQFYCLNCPNVDTTLVYDLTFKQWHERAELVNGNYQPWRPTCHAFAYGKHFYGADDGYIYVHDKTINTFAGDPKCRDRISPVVSAPDMKRLRFPAFELLADRATVGNVLLRYSDDNGFTWSNWHYTSSGALGEYKQRMKFYRLGSARDRVFQVRMTDDAPFNPVTVNVEVA